MNVVCINTYGGSLLLGAKATKATILATMEDVGYGSDLQALNFPKVPRYEKTEDWPEKFDVPWRKVDVIAHPPCKSFSIMAARFHHLHGTETDGFACHRRVIDYTLGNQCRSLAIESVIGAYAGGQDAYEEMAKKYHYHLTYVFLNAVSFGVPQWRPRIWMLFHRAKTFKVDLHPHYVALREILSAGPTEPNVMNRCKRVLYAAIKHKDRYHGIHIYKALMREYGFESDAEIQKRFPEARGYLSGHVRFVDPNWVSTTIMGDTTLAYENRILSLEEYCQIVGFPRDYKWGRRVKTATAYLSRGVSPPVAAWVLEMQDRNARGWAGSFTHEQNEDNVIDLRVKRAEVETALGRPSTKQPRKPAQARLTKPYLVKAVKAPPAPRGRCYVLVNEAKAYAPGSPQAEFILAALKRAGQRGLTRAEVVTKAVADPKRFPTNQPHDRAVGFWLSKLKGQGALEFAR